MPDIFAPQLVLFVAGRSELALYREFVFPSVPARTGLLAVGIDDIRATSREIEPLAIDIALSKAAVVVYDREQRSRLPLDYVEALREGRSIVVVEARRPAAVPLPPGDGLSGTGPTGAVVRPSDMSLWIDQFVEPLLVALTRAAPGPSPLDIDRQLRSLAEDGRYSDLLLTALALLENRMRRADLPTAVPTDPSGGAMARLRDHFGSDYARVLEAVALRHDLLRDPDPKDEDEDEKLRSSASALADVARRRLVGSQAGQKRPTDRGSAGPP